MLLIIHLAGVFRELVYIIFTCYIIDYTVNPRLPALLPMYEICDLCNTCTKAVFQNDVSSLSLIRPYALCTERGLTELLIWNWWFPIVGASFIET